MLGFALAEMPTHLPPSSPEYRYLQSRVEGFAPARFDALGDLYHRVRELFETIPDEVLFLGPPGAQFTTHDVFPGSIRGLDISKSPAYGIAIEKVCDGKSAVAVVDQIIEEGEGAKEQGSAGSHFSRFMSILMALTDMQERDCGFEPARPVVANPSIRGAAPPENEITFEFSRDALNLFESSYETMLLGLTRFFTFPQNDQAELSALQQAFFFPMMTTITRPLGEVLTMLPANASGSMESRAGPSFRAPETFSLTPHKSAAFNVLSLRLGEMESMASKLHARAASLPEATPKALITTRLDFLYQQIYRMRRNLEINYGKMPDGP